MKEQEMIVNHNGFFDDLGTLNSKQLRQKGSISFLSKKQRIQMELARIDQREEALKAARAKKQADLELIEDEEDDFRVKISASDYKLL